MLVTRICHHWRTRDSTQEQVGVDCKDPMNPDYSPPPTMSQSLSTYTPLQTIQSPQSHLSRPLDAILPLLGPSNTDIFMDATIIPKMDERRDMEELDDGFDSGGQEPRFASDLQSDSLLTNDGATFLLHLSQLNSRLAPSERLNLDGAILLKELSCCMDHVGGDGTTGVVCLVRAMLNLLNVSRGDASGENSLPPHHNSIKKVLSPRWNPFHIRDAISNILSNETNLLDHMLDAVQITHWDKEKSMRVLARTTLSSKISSFVMPTMIDLAVEAISLTNGRYERNRDDSSSSSGSTLCIDLIKQLGAPVSNSKILGGSMIRLQVHQVVGFDSLLYSHSDDGENDSLAQFSLTLPKAPHKCAIIQFPLSLPSQSHLIIATSTEQVDKLIREETVYTKKIVGMLRKCKIQVCFVEENHRVSSLNDNGVTRRLLEKFGIRVLVLKRSEIERMMSVMQGVISLTSVRQLQELSTGGGSAGGKGGNNPTTLPTPQSHTFDIQSLTLLDAGREVCIQCDAHVENRACVLLTAPSQTTLSELERALHDALKVLEIFYEDPRLVYGGGSSEMAISSHLQHQVDAQLHCPVHQSSSVLSAMRRIGEAFEEIPSLLAKNCGLSSESILQQFRSAHARGEYHCGLLVQGESIARFCNYMHESGTEPPVELYHNKKAQIVMALETTWQLLKLDEIFKWNVESSGGGE